MTETSQWKAITLGELADYVDGRAFKPSEWTTHGRPIIRIQNLTNAYKPFNYYDSEVEPRYEIRDGDLLVSWSATLGAYIWNRGEAILNQHIFKVTPYDSIVDKEFLYYLLLTTIDRMKEWTHGSTMKHITRAKFRAIKVAIPCIDEQRRIVSRVNELLGRIDKMSLLRKTAIEETHALVPSLLHEQFETLGKQYPSVTIDDICSDSSYGTSRKCSNQRTGTPILRIPNVAQGAVNATNLKYCTLSERELRILALKKGDLLFVRTNGSPDLVGRCAIFDLDGTTFAFASYLIRLRVDLNKVVPQFVSYFLQSASGRDALANRRRTSAGQYNINSANLRSISLPLPPVAVQLEMVDQMTDQIRIAKQIASESEHQYEHMSLLRTVVLQNATSQGF